MGVFSTGVQGSILAQSRRETRQPLFKFPAKNRAHAQPAQVFLVHRRIEAIETKVRPRIQRANLWNQPRRQPRCRMHRHIERDQIRRANRRFIERFTRKIEARNLVSSRAQPRRRRRQAERLPAEFVRRDEDDIHLR